MPLVRDNPSTQGDVPGPDPARAPPNKAIAQAGLACRGQPAGVSLASQGSATRGAPLPPRAGRAWSTFGPHASGPSGSPRSPAVHHSPRLPVRARSARHRRPLVRNGTSGRGRRTRITGHTASTAPTSTGEAGRRWVRIRPDGSRLTAQFPNGTGGRQGLTATTAELVPATAGKQVNSAVASEAVEG
jgi:hypothetical protein